MPESSDKFRQFIEISEPAMKRASSSVIPPISYASIHRGLIEYLLDNVPGFCEDTIAWEGNDMIIISGVSKEICRRVIEVLAQRSIQGRIKIYDPEPDFLLKELERDERVDSEFLENHFGLLRLV